MPRTVGGYVGANKSDGGDADRERDTLFGGGRGHSVSQRAFLSSRLGLTSLYPRFSRPSITSHSTDLPFLSITVSFNSFSLNTPSSLFKFSSDSLSLL
jgi:hypothetical protein